MLKEQMAFLETKAPRYTSYPSSLYFRELNESSHQQWLTEFDDKQSIALYVHIPFCSQLCWFCGCHTKISNHYTPIYRYVQALLKEITLIKKHAPALMKLHSIHFGGGSPNILTDEDLESIMRHIAANFDIQDDAEIAIELDPRHLNQEKTHTYQRLNFNRVSLGVQDTNPTVQEAIHRIQPFDQIRQGCDMLRSANIDNINIDLIYGLPFQTLPSIAKSFSDVCSLSPSRIAYYSFAHIPHVKPQHRLISEKDLPNTHHKAQMYLQAVEIAQKHHYIHLGIDHFMQPDDTCVTSFHQKKFRRNFMGYTSQKNDFVLGIGASSISNLGKGLSQNHSITAEYERKITRGTWATARGWCYNKEDLLRKRIIDELMCYFSADIGLILTDHDYPIDYFDQNLCLLKTFVDKEVIVIHERRIDFISPLRMLVRAVCSVFDQYHLSIEENRYLRVS